MGTIFLCFQGLDFAWSANGYVYHTKLDTVDKIPLGTFQRTGDNMLPLILKLVNSKQISDIEKYSTGNLVYIMHYYYLILIINTRIDYIIYIYLFF